MICNQCQNIISEGKKYCKYCGAKVSAISKVNYKKALFLNKYKKYLLGSLVLFVILIILIALYNDKKYQIEKEQEEKIALLALEKKDAEEQEARNKKRIFSRISESVVNVICDESGGSGTIITEDGLIITNSHIFTNDDDCLVILPESETGTSKEMYWATPLRLSELSELYDLAFLQIYDVYVDEDYIAYGNYPNKFTHFDDTDLCSEDNVKLGEAVRILGYPNVSGGYSLTITDGIVSSFPGDGLIMTSAKIDSGNSGGLAIDQSGCRIGIPTAVSQGDYESLGVIISNNLIYEFIDLVSENLE